MTNASPDRLVDIAYAYRESKALLTAVELGVFTVLAGGGLSLEALSGRLGLHGRGARDFLDALVALGVLDRDEGGQYRNTPEAARFLDRGRDTYIGAEMEFINAHLYGHWNGLTTALRTGQPVNPMATAEGGYKRRYTRPAEVMRFARAMTAATRPVARALASAFAWSDHRTMADVGSGQGCLPVELARQHPHLRCVGFDLAPMQAVFDRYVADHGLADRVRFSPGDFFEDPLPGADVIVIGRVLHNWDTPGKVAILRKAYDALPEGGTVIVYERLIDDERRREARALLSSLNMLVMTPGGFDFSAADCIGWMGQVGFRGARVSPLTADQTMVVGFR
ncbi:MAG: methyltransferase domain-containing protein [Burkholderiaceae bacterium]|nr:methyltransferase domain-containing protein [Burkholderiaceae bacterium]